MGARSPVLSFSAQEMYQPHRVSTREEALGWGELDQVMEEEKMRQIVYFSLEEEQLKGGLLAACSYLLGSCKEDESRFL